MWTLYVDETGDFGVPGRGVAVVGLLLRAPPDPQEFQRRVAETWRGVPWPPHGSTLDKPAALLLSWDKGGWKGLPRALRRELQPALKLRHGAQLKDHQSLVRYGLRLRAMPRVLEILEAERLRHLHQSAQLWRDLQSSQRGGMHGVAVVGRADPAADTQRCYGMLRSDSYVEQLRALLLMVRERLLPAQGVVHVALRVADRHVRMAALAQPVPFSRPLQLALLQDIEAQPLAGSGDVRFVQHTKRVRYGHSGTLAGVVLADWLANRMRQFVYQSLPPDSLNRRLLSVVDSPLMWRIGGQTTLQWRGRSAPPWARVQGGAS